MKRDHLRAVMSDAWESASEEFVTCPSTHPLVGQCEKRPRHDGLHESWRVATPENGSEVAYQSWVQWREVPA